MIIIGTNIPNIINTFFNNEDMFANKILIIDKDNVFEGTLGTLNETPSNVQDDSSIEDEFIIEENPEISFEDLKSKIESNDITAALIISKNESTINLEYIVENTGMVTSIPETYIQIYSYLN